MKKHLYILMFCFSVVSVVAQEKEEPPKGGEPKDFNLPEKEVITYDNGLELVMIPYGSIPKANIQVVVKTGKIHEAEDEIWLSGLVGDLLKEGSTTKSSSEIADEMAGMGGNLNVGVGLHAVNINTSVLYEFAPDAISLIADVLKNPLWPESELRRLKNDMNRSLSVSLSSPQSQASRDFYAHFYTDHAYGRVFPTEEQIEAYTIEDVRNFYDENFNAGSTTIYVAGTFDRDQVQNAVENHFADWREGTPSAYVVAIPTTEKNVVIIDRPGAPQSTIMLGLPVIDPSNEDYVALEVTNSLLGGSFASRITSNIREDKGYTYSPRSLVDARYKTGLWYEMADVTTEFTGESIKEILNEINRLQQEPPTPEELEGIVNYESGLFVLRNSTPGGIINQMIFLDMHGLDDSYLKNKISRMKELTPEDIQDITTKYIRPEDLTLVVVGDKSVIESQVKENFPQ